MPDEEIAQPGATGDPVKDYAAGLIRDPDAEPVESDPEFETAAGATGDTDADEDAGLIRDETQLQDVEDIDDTTKVELQDRAIQLGLPYSGTKAEIAERIRHAEGQA